MKRQPGFLTILTAVAAIAITACSGGTSGSGTLPVSVASPATAMRSRTTFSITVPKPAPTSFSARRPAYISPATQSMTISIKQGATTILSRTVGLSASSSGCSSTLADVACTLMLSLNPGSYTASITTFDGSNGGGTALSTAQNVTFTVVANQNNLVPLTLSGIPRTILVTAAGAHAVYVLAQDADGNFIIGSGAPAFIAARSSGPSLVAITQPTSSAPNTISFASVSPPLAGAETIGITASFPAGLTNTCAIAGAACTNPAAVTATYSSGTAFLANNGDGNVLGYTLPLTGNAQAPIVTLSGMGFLESGIAMNSSGTLFTWGYESGGSTIVAAPPYVSPQVVNNSATGLNLAYYPGTVAANGTLFVPENIAPAGAVAVLTPPYNGAATAVTAGTNYPTGTASDANDTLYVANSEAQNITVYAPPYTSGPEATISTTGYPNDVFIFGKALVVSEDASIDIFTLPVTSTSKPTTTFALTGSVAYLAEDAKGDLWTACPVGCLGGTAGEVDEFPAPFTNGEKPAVQLTMPARGFTSFCPASIGFDAIGNLYVNNIGNASTQSGLLEYSGTITSRSTPTFGIETGELRFAAGMVISPGVLTITP